MKARYVIGKKLLGTVPFMKAGSAAICLVATTMAEPNDPNDLPY